MLLYVLSKILGDHVTTHKHTWFSYPRWKGNCKYCRIFQPIFVFFHSFANSIGNQYSPLPILGLVDTLPKIFHSDENLLTLHLVSLSGAIVTFMVLVMHTISYMIYLSVICWYIIIVFLIVEHEILPIEFQMALPTKFRHSRWFKPDILLRSTISSGA